MKQHHPLRGRSGGWQQAEQPDATDAPDWIAGRLPEGWFAGDPTSSSTARRSRSSADFPTPEAEESDARASGRAARFREETRSERMRIADEAEARYGRKVAWGVEVAGELERILFTHIAVPVMTRLRNPSARCSTPSSTRAWRGRARMRWSGRCGWSASTPRNGSASCARR